MNKRILLIEDEAAVASYLGTFLRQEGFAVERAATLGQARTIFNGGFDLVLLDLMLPDGTGAEILPELRKTAPRTPVLIVTGVAPDDDRLISCLKNGAAGYIGKNARVDELLRHIYRVLGG